MERFNFSLTVLSQTPKVCEIHGPYTEIEYKQYTRGCPVCEENSRLEQERKDEERRRQDIIDRLMERACIPLRFSDRRLSTFVATNPGQQKALDISQSFVDGYTRKSGQSLIFCGGVGAGKTHLSVGIAHDLIQKGVGCVFTSVIAAIRSVKETYTRGSEYSEREALDNLIRPDLLILDEVGVQFGSEAEKLILFEIINGRYENMKSTIVISNLAIGALSDYLGDRVIDRLREGGGKMVVFDWDSYRRQAA